MSNDMGALSRRFDKELEECGGQLDALFARYSNRVTELVVNGCGTKDPEFVDATDMLDCVIYSMTQAFMEERGWTWDLDDVPYYRWVKKAPT